MTIPSPRTGQMATLDFWTWRRRKMSFTLTLRRTTATGPRSLMDRLEITILLHQTHFPCRSGRIRRTLLSVQSGLRGGRELRRGRRVLWRRRRCGGGGVRRTRGLYQTIFVLVVISALCCMLWGVLFLTSLSHISWIFVPRPNTSALLSLFSASIGVTGHIYLSFHCYC